MKRLSEVLFMISFFEISLYCFPFKYSSLFIGSNMVVQIFIIKIGRNLTAARICLSFQVSTREFGDVPFDFSRLLIELRI